MPLNETGKCSHCCSSNLCNKDGCGEQVCKMSSTHILFLAEGIIDQAKRVRCCNSNLCNENSKSQSLTLKPMKPDNTVSVNNIEATTYSTKFYSTTSVINKDSQLTDFILLFPDGKYYEHAQPKVFLTSNDSDVFLAFNFCNHTIQPFSFVRNKTEYLLDQTDGLKQAGLQLYGRYISSVYGFILDQPYYPHHYSEGYLAIPTRYLGTTYIIPSFQVLNSRNVITVSPTKSSTSVTVNLKISLGFVKYSNKQYLTVII
ncbi:unnamed protein product [Mytilus coruscus]|uniref:IgGFc-binding protein N-terminal domain-containing protein n=1 Tax=Mytilus coruscus TaxID=42192 RepID=A0A6J7ZWI3_MYTCO|nr:unnamed protein product [Mytilus coruscus]